MKIRQKRLMVFSLALGLLLSIALSTFYPETDDYLLDNSGPNGCSRIHDLVKTATENDLRKIGDFSPKQALVMIVSPLKPFNREEIESLRRFIQRGGTALLADNLGEGNSLLEQLGVPARFDRTPLEDPLFYGKQPQFPVVYDLARSPLTTGINELLLGNPTAITITDESNVKILARTSPYSFLDENHNGNKDADEERGPFVALAALNIDQGVLILLSSPDMLMNAQLGEKHNSKLILNIIGFSGGPARPFTLLFDEGHLERSWGTPLRQTLREIFFIEGPSRIRIETRFALASIAACLGFLFTIPHDEPQELPHPSFLIEEAQKLSRKHPEWDSETLEYLGRHTARTAGRGLLDKGKE